MKQITTAEYAQMIGGAMTISMARMHLEKLCAEGFAQRIQNPTAATRWVLSALPAALPLRIEAPPAAPQDTALRSTDGLELSLHLVQLHGILKQAPLSAPQVAARLCVSHQAAYNYLGLLRAAGRARPQGGNPQVWHAL